jgi:hypothetical protein
MIHKLSVGLVMLVALALAGCQSHSTKTTTGAVAPQQAPAVTPAAPTATATPIAVKECSAFTTQAAANEYLKATPAAKPKLDTDGDGMACESKFAPRPTVTPEATARARAGTSRSGSTFDPEATCGGYDPNYRDPRCGPYPDQRPDSPGYQAPGYQQRPQTRHSPGTPATNVPPGYHACGDTGAICPDE